MKIVSLLPSATEMLYLLDAQEMLVGLSHECDYPELAKQKSICSFSNIDSTKSSLEIDSQVKGKIENSLSLYEVNFEKLKELKPDLVITQDQCKVCAVSRADLENGLEEKLKRKVDIISFHPNSLNDIFEDFLQLAKKIGKEKFGLEIIEEWKSRLELIQHKLKHVKVRPRVLFIEWIEPLMLAGNWTPELIEWAGGENVLTEKFTHSKYFSWEEIRESDPDIIVIAPCGFAIPQSLSEYAKMCNLEGWSTLKAVKNNKVFVADGNAYFNRPGPRIIDSIEMLAEIIAAGNLMYGFEGTGFVKMLV